MALYKTNYIPRIVFMIVLIMFCITEMVAQSTRGQERTQERIVDNPEIIVRTYPNNVRIIPPGKGDEYNEDFVQVNQFYFVQFAVYNINRDWREIHAPETDEQLWLIEHPDTYVQGNQVRGAYYIVKPCNSEAEAQAVVARYKRRGIDCFFNRELSNISFIIRAFNRSSFPE